MAAFVFFGTPKFAVPSLKALQKASFYEIKAVVTQPDKPVGRHHSKPAPSPVKKAAQALNLPVLEGLDGVKEIRADLGVVVAYGEILPKWVLDHFSLGIVNIHPSLLPKYRGPSPIQAAILNCDTETGVTLMKLDDKMDHGPILAQEIYPTPALPLVRAGRKNLLFSPFTKGGVRGGSGGLGGGLTAGELSNRLFHLGAEMLIKYLPDYIAGKIKAVPQEESKATYTKKLTKEDGKIDWSKPQEEIEAHIRAMNPWPGAWTMWMEKRLIVWRVSLRAERSGAKQSYNRIDGATTVSKLNRDDRIASPSARNDIVLEEVQLEGKTKMSYSDFLRGHPDFSL